MILSAFLILFLFKISEYVSVLSRKNQELAMQVSLLNQENERILTELQQLTGKTKQNFNIGVRMKKKFYL